MHPEIIPEGDEFFRHPFFISPLTYYYRLSFCRQRNSITYSSPHEVLLNLRFFEGGDTTTYVNRENNQEVFRISIDRFKAMLLELIYSVSQEEVEQLYLRLLLANRNKERNIDRARLPHYDIQVKKNY
jgi:hypothetical protein